MSDKQKPSNLPGDPEPQDSSLNADRDPAMEKNKSGRSRKNTRASLKKDQIQIEEVVPEIEEQTSADDDVLADIRRSLVEEETSKREKKKKGIFQRVTKLIKPGKAPSIEEPAMDEANIIHAVEDVHEVMEDAIVLPSGEEKVLVVEADTTLSVEAGDGSAVSTPQEDVEAFILSLEPGEFIPLESRGELISPLESVIVEQARGSEVLRTQVEKGDDSFGLIREVALEDYGDAPFQSENMPKVSRRQKLRALLKGLKPLDKVLIFGAFILIFVAGMIGFGYSIIKAQVPTEAAVPTEDLPVPVRVTLPGGWAFNLGRGVVDHDRWSPAGPEWLAGTELCKWVALPSSVQLEAVVRTLKLDDPIVLTMSNTDQLKYKVRSKQNVPVDQVDTLEGKAMCLLLILVDQDSDSRWVVIAEP